MQSEPFFEVPEISSIQDMIVKSAAKYKNKIALEDLAKTPINYLSYDELISSILSFGSALKELGLQERSHIAVLGENRVQWALSYLTCMCFNYVVVPVDRNLTNNEIINIIYESDTDAVVFSSDFESLFEEKHSVLKKVKHYINMDLSSPKSFFKSMPQLISKAKKLSLSNLPRISPADPAEIIFTSGSLGRAKGVVLSQGNIASNLMAMVSSILIYPEDKFLSVLPMHHTYECTCGMLCPLYCGASAHYARSLRTIVDDLTNVKATVMLGVPLLFDKMFKRIYKQINEDKVKSKIIKPLIKVTDVFSLIGWKNSKKVIFAELHKKFGGSIRMFIAGGAAPDPKVAKGLREFGFTFVQGYGLTETSPIVALNRLKSLKDDAAGIPLPNLQIKIENPDEDGIGEILVKGPSVMLGYYKNQKLTDESFTDGWFNTGDLGCFDKDGFLHIPGRKKNVIIANNGKNVFPEEIEDILNRNPFIQECLVYGEKDAKHDEAIAVQIVTDAEAFIEYSQKNNISITEELIYNLIDEAIKEANKELASYKQIKKFYIREKEFEKTTTQKIKRYTTSNG